MATAQPAESPTEATVTTPPLEATVPEEPKRKPILVPDENDLRRQLAIAAQCPADNFTIRCVSAIRDKAIDHFPKLVEEADKLLLVFKNRLAMAV